MPTGRYGTVTGGSDLADFLTGFVGGYQSGDDLRARREQERLLREREARYAEEQRLEQEDRLLQRERQAALDATQGVFRTDQVDPTEQVTVGTMDGGLRGDLDAAGRGLRSLGLGIAGDAVAGVGDLPDATENRYQVAGNFAIDRTRHDPLLAERMEADRTRQQEAGVRRGLLALTGTDDKPLFRPREVLGQSGDELKALSSLGVTLPVERRMAEQDRVTRNADQVAAEDRAFGRTQTLDQQRHAYTLREQSHASELRRAEDAARVVRASPGGAMSAFNPKDPNLGLDPGAMGKTTVSERQAASRGERYAGGLRIIQAMPMPNGLQAVIARSQGQSAENIRGAIETWAKRAVADPHGQRYAYNLLRMAEPALRDASGAQINEDELPRIIGILDPGAGADPQVRADAYRAQDDILLGFALNAGNAMANPLNRGLREEIRQIMDPAAYMARRARQFKMAGYSDQEALERARQDVRERFEAGGTP